jgi:hypothetical protein
MIQELVVTKYDAAKRQLETAVLLYFNEMDPVSIHTLAAAGYNILRDINTKKGGDPMLLKDDAAKLVKPEQLGEFKKKMNEAENFFKHADRDHDKSIKFRPAFSEFFLLGATHKYRDLTSESVPLFQLFDTWHMIINPSIYILPPEIERLRLSIEGDYINDRRMKFLQEVYPLMLNVKGNIL